MEFVYIVAILAGTVITLVRMGLKPKITARTRFGDSITLEAEKIEQPRRKSTRPGE